MLLLLVLAACAVATADRSPNADIVDQLFGDSAGYYPADVIENAKLSLNDLAIKSGYPFESHTVVTQDGYILTMHRIPHGRGNQTNDNRTVVFLNHGLYSSSATFLVLGPDNALAYLLADEGYDVWLGNARGNFFSRRHMWLDPNRDKAFWEFSWDEIGNHDMPACLDHIERVTGQTRLHYIGHSQGATVFFVLNSLRPQYNKKFISFQGMAASTFIRTVKYARIGAPLLINFFKDHKLFLGTGEAVNNTMFINFIKTNCIKESLCEYFLMNQIKTFNQLLAPVFLAHAPVSASSRQFLHYDQLINSKAFRRYNYGPHTNLVTYGSILPPDYNVTQIAVPSYLYASVGDHISSASDQVFLIKKLKCPVELILVNSTDFVHLDYVWGSNVKRLVYDTVISKLKLTEVAKNKVSRDSKNTQQ